MKISLLFFLLFLIGNNSYAFEEAKVKNEMKQMASVLAKLYPHIYSENFNLKKNEGEIKNLLEALIIHFEKARPELDKDAKALKISAQVIDSHLRETLSTFSGKHKSFSQNMIQALPNLCFSCHAKDGITSLAVENIKRNQFPSDFAFAEFNFMTRNYDRANHYYDKTIAIDGKNEITSNKALERKLNLYVKAFHFDKSKLVSFTQLKKNKKLSHTLKAKASSWVEILESPDLNIKPIAQIGYKAFEKRYLSSKEPPRIITAPREKIFYLSLQSELESYFLKVKDEQETPRILYWMGILEESLNHNLFYSLSEIYLKECMLKYSKNPIAKKCYKEYENNINFSFSGSAGTFIPDDLKAELSKFRKLIGL